MVQVARGKNRISLTSSGILVEDRYGATTVRLDQVSGITYRKAVPFVGGSLIVHTAIPWGGEGTLNPRREGGYLSPSYRVTWPWWHRFPAERDAKQVADAINTARHTHH